MAMPVMWQAGYEWAWGRGPSAELDIDDAMDAEGIEFGSPGCRLFLKGAETAQKEQSE